MAIYGFQIISQIPKGETIVNKGKEKREPEDRRNKAVEEECDGMN